MIDTIPLVSVVMPAYNSSKHIEEAIRSIQAQTYVHWEVIIINDGSTDNTALIIQQLQEKDNRIRLYTQENKGMAFATRLGLQKATGEYIAFMDSDDIIHEERFAKQVAYLNENPSVDILGTNLYILKDGKKQEANFFIYGKSFPDHMVRLLPVICPCFPHPTAMLRKKAIEGRYHYFRNIPSVFKGATPTQKKGNFADIYFSLLMVRAGCSVRTLPERLYTYRIEGNSLLHNENKQASEAYCYRVLTKIYARLFFGKTNAIPDIMARVIINAAPESKIPLWEPLEAIQGMGLYLEEYFKRWSMTTEQQKEVIHFLMGRLAAYCIAWLMTHDDIIYDKKTTPWVATDIARAKGYVWAKKYGEHIHTNVVKYCEPHASVAPIAIAEFKEITNVYCKRYFGLKSIEGRL